VRNISELSLDASSIDSTDFGLKAKDELVPDISIYIESPKVDDNPAVM
jgi:hypothetical protein